MNSWSTVLGAFFTHKDFLPPADCWPGTLFSPAQILVCALVAVGIGYGAVSCARKREDERQKVYFVLWLLMAVSEPLIIWWDAAAGAHVGVDWSSALSLWPCSIFLYAAPFAIFGKGDVRKAACGYICTLGLLGGLINFVYPANYLSRYSILSMAGIRTVFYHGAMVFTAVTMLLSGEHSYRQVKTRKDLFLPMIPTLLVSVPANIANFLIPGADYMFFKMESFFFAPIGQALPTWATIIMVYVFYMIVHLLPYLPAWRAVRKQSQVCV